MERDGFEGPDASLAGSLFEYGIAWRHDKEAQEPDEYEFVIGVGYSGGVYDQFESRWMSKKEWEAMILGEGWFDTQAVCDFAGMTPQALLDGFPRDVQTAIQYYGYENMFGVLYYPGARISF